MSEEKSLEEIAFDAGEQACHEFYGNEKDEWIDLNHKDKEIMGRMVKAVIAEFQRSNGEPVAWISHNVLTGKDHYNKLPVQSLQPGVYKHTALYAAPQPLPEAG